MLKGICIKRGITLWTIHVQGSERKGAHFVSLSSHEDTNARMCTLCKSLLTILQIARCY
jgi:hypothetical protein